jgi:phosphoserine aminotransferase
MTKGGKVNRSIFEGDTINTPSMLCIEDYLDALSWAEKLGGLPALLARADKNFAVIEDWVQSTPWIEFMASVPETRSNTSVCLKIVDPWFLKLDDEAQRKVQKDIEAALEKERVALDVGNHRDAPAGLRIWCGATVEAEDLKALTPWLEWAFQKVKATAGA